MDQVHFQTNLFQEIIHGIATSCEGYMLEGKEMIEAAANIYLSLEKSSEQQAKEETDIISEWKDGQFRYSRICTCKKCDQKIVRYIADGLKYCPGCGRKIRENEK